MRKLLVPIVTLVVLAFAAPQTSGQVTFGAQLSYGDDIENLGIGVRAYRGLDEFMEGLTGVASFVYWFWNPEGVDSSTAWELNIDGHYPMAFGEIDGYVGGGINIAYASFKTDIPIIGTVEDSDTQVGLNVLAGATFGSSDKMIPFAELKLELGGGEQLVIQGGVKF
jgi:opacity protein-like surface antigen